jgi:hypothetical protein
MACPTCCLQLGTAVGDPDHRPSGRAHLINTVDRHRAKVGTIDRMNNEQRWRSRDRWWRRQSQINLGIALVILAFLAWTAACP